MNLARPMAATNLYKFRSVARFSSAISAPLREILVCGPLFGSPPMWRRKTPPFEYLSQRRGGRGGKPVRLRISDRLQPPHSADLPGKSSRRETILHISSTDRTQSSYLCPSVAQNEFFRILRNATADTKLRPNSPFGEQAVSGPHSTPVTPSQRGSAPANRAPLALCEPARWAQKASAETLFPS
jgi:hypothetical protein